MRTPNPEFGGQMSIPVVERGEAERIWRMVFRLDAGGGEFSRTGCRIDGQIESPSIRRLLSAPGGRHHRTLRMTSAADSATSTTMPRLGSGSRARRAAMASSAFFSNRDDLAVKQCNEVA